MPASLKIALTVICLLAGVTLVACSRSDTPAGPVDDGFASDRDRVSYVLGVDVGRRLGPAGDEIDLEVFEQALRDSMEGREPRFQESDLVEVRQAFALRMQERQQSERARLAEHNRSEGEQFLATNASAAGVKVTPSGLQYRVLREGDGPRPRLRDKVRVHYEGSLIDGTVFDSSVQRGEPAEFALNGVIQGWTEALQMMPVGSKYQLFVPPHLAYREQGSASIGPNATLIFDVELIAIAD